MGHYGHDQEVARNQEERVETEDLETRLAEIYAGIQGGEDAFDLTAPRVRQLITSGAVKRPPQLTYYQPLLGAPEKAAQLDVGLLGEAAFASTTGAEQASQEQAIAPVSLVLTYNRALGVDPAARPAKLSVSEQAEASALMTATSLRDLTLPD